MYGGRLEDRIKPAHLVEGLSGPIALHRFARIGHMPHLEARCEVAKLTESWSRPVDRPGLGPPSNDPYFCVSVSLRAVTASVTRVVGFSSLSAPRIAASLCAPPAANTRTGAARTTSSGTDMTHWLRG
jgi:hypothetical protein